jgi:DNA-binding transcriptional MerR regulator
MMLTARYNIGQLAKAAGVPTTTVRFYERRRLILPTGRTRSNYRWYDQRSLERLRFIKLAQSGGFLLNDICAILEPHNGSAAQCRRVAEIIEHRLKNVRSQITELRRLQKVLGRELALCRASKPRQCAVVEEMRVVATTARRNGSL